MVSTQGESDIIAMRKLYTILILFTILAGGFAWIAFQEVPPPQEMVEQSLDYKDFITK